MKTSLDLFKEKEPYNWAEIDKISVDYMLNFADELAKEAYNKALEDAAENADVKNEIVTKNSFIHSRGMIIPNSTKENKIVVDKQSILKLKKP